MRPGTNRRNDGGSPGVGSASMILIFSILCLTVFALLTLTTARSEHSLSQASVQAVEDYYTADSYAEAILAEIRQAENSGRKVPASWNDIAIDSGLGGLYIYQVPISEQQALRVELLFDAAGGYQILCWKAVSTVDWVADDSLNVWDGAPAF